MLRKISLMVWKTCQTCNGSGKVAGKTCTACNGAGGINTGNV